MLRVLTFIAVPLGSAELRDGSGLSSWAVAYFSLLHECAFWGTMTFGAWARLLGSSVLRHRWHAPFSLPAWMLQQIQCNFETIKWQPTSVVNLSLSFTTIQIWHEVAGRKGTWTPVPALCMFNILGSYLVYW
jgi:hypothetical protein